jgi:hypothetical protein
MPAASFQHGYEADIAIARLAAAQIPAVKRGDGFVGLLAPVYDQRPTQRVEVLVPSDLLGEAHRALNAAPGTA